MSFAHLPKPAWRSLRMRLMAWNALVALATVGVTLFAVREGVRIALVRELDDTLREDLNEIEIALRDREAPQKLYEQLDRKDAGHARHLWFAELIAPDRSVRYKSLHAPPADVWYGVKNQTAHTSGLWRLLERKEPTTGTTVRVGAAIGYIHADIARLDRYAMLAACGMLAAAPLCGYWLAGRATVPLARIIATAARLRPSHLDERLEIRGAGDEIDRLSETLNRLLDRIGKYLQEHRDFLANSAHELRTPLAAIRSSVEVALQGGRTREEYEDLLTDIIEESAGLELLVNQLLLLSETEAELLKLDKQHGSLIELIEKAIDMFGGLAEFRDIRLVCAELSPAMVRGNREHLRQVIYNLLDNALKFTPAGGSVVVSLKEDRAQQVVELVIEDTGAGIPENELPHVFNRFFHGNRLHGGLTERRGTGLGLSICQAIVRAHDGVIQIDSRLDEGTRVTVRLPCVADEEVDSSFLERNLETRAS